MGYIGGKSASVTHEEVCAGETGHAEAVRVVFDPSRISLADLLRWFWESHELAAVDMKWFWGGGSWPPLI